MKIRAAVSCQAHNLPLPQIACFATYFELGEHCAPWRSQNSQTNSDCKFCDQFPPAPWSRMEYIAQNELSRTFFRSNLIESKQSANVLYCYSAILFGASGKRASFKSNSICWSAGRLIESEIFRMLWSVDHVVGSRLGWSEVFRSSRHDSVSILSAEKNVNACVVGEMPLFGRWTSELPFQRKLTAGYEPPKEIISLKALGDVVQGFRLPLPAFLNLVSRLPAWRATPSKRAEQDFFVTKICSQIPPAPWTGKKYHMSERSHAFFSSQGAIPFRALG